MWATLLPLWVGSPLNEEKLYLHIVDFPKLTYCSLQLYHICKHHICYLLFTIMILPCLPHLCCQRNVFRTKSVCVSQLSWVWICPPAILVFDNQRNRDKLGIVRWRVMWQTMVTQIAKFIGPTWGPPGSNRPQMGPMLAPWTLLSRHIWLCGINGFLSPLSMYWKYISHRMVQNSKMQIRAHFFYQLWLKHSCILYNFLNIMVELISIWAKCLQRFSCGLTVYRVIHFPHDKCKDKLLHASYGEMLFYDIYNMNNNAQVHHLIREIWQQLHRSQV